MTEINLMPFPLHLSSSIKVTGTDSDFSAEDCQLGSFLTNYFVQMKGQMKEFCNFSSWKLYKLTKSAKIRFYKLTHTCLCMYVNICASTISDAPQ